MVEKMEQEGYISCTLIVLEEQIYFFLHFYYNFFIHQKGTIYSPQFKISLICPYPPLYKQRSVI